MKSSQPAGKERDKAGERPSSFSLGRGRTIGRGVRWVGPAAMSSSQAVGKKGHKADKGLYFRSFPDWDNWVRMQARSSAQAEAEAAAAAVAQAAEARSSTQAEAADVADDGRLPPSPDSSGRGTQADAEVTAADVAYEGRLPPSSDFSGRSRTSPLHYGVKRQLTPPQREPDVTGACSGDALLPGKVYTCPADARAGGDSHPVESAGILARSVVDMQPDDGGGCPDRDMGLGLPRGLLAEEGNLGGVTTSQINKMLEDAETRRQIEIMLHQKRKVPANLGAQCVQGVAAGVDPLPVENARVLYAGAYSRVDTQPDRDMDLDVLREVFGLGDLDDADAMHQINKMLHEMRAQDLLITRQQLERLLQQKHVQRKVPANLEPQFEQGVAGASAGVNMEFGLDQQSLLNAAGKINAHFLLQNAPLIMERMREVDLASTSAVEEVQNCPVGTDPGDDAKLKVDQSHKLASSQVSPIYNKTDRYAYTWGIHNNDLACMIMLVVVLNIFMSFVPLPDFMDDSVSVVWRMSLLLCSNLFILILPMRTTGIFNIFSTIFFGPLFAYATTNLVGSLAGMAIVYLSTARAAGMFGFSLAQYRLYIGTQLAANGAVTLNPSELSKNERRQRLYSQVYSVFYAGSVMLCLTALVLWVMMVPTDVDIHFVIWGLSVLVWWIICCALIILSVFMYHGPLITGRVMIYYIASLPASFPCALISLRLWTSLFGLGMMVMSAYFGYMLAICTRYKELVPEDTCLEDIMSDIEEDEKSTADSAVITREGPITLGKAAAEEKPDVSFKTEDSGSRQNVPGKELSDDLGIFPGED